MMSLPFWSNVSLSGFYPRMSGPGEGVTYREEGVCSLEDVCSQVGVSTPMVLIFSGGSSRYASMLYLR